MYFDAIASQPSFVGLNSYAVIACYNKHIYFIISKVDFCSAKEH